jgi:uncharacterized small protein (DUF1192 family)
MAMDTETSVQELHQRLVRGVALTEAEQARLATWYDQEDASELALLALRPSAPAIAELQAHLTATFDQLREAMIRVAELTEQNSSLRQEIGRLEVELARRAASRVA